MTVIGNRFQPGAFTSLRPNAPSPAAPGPRTDIRLVATDGLDVTVTGAVAGVDRLDLDTLELDWGDGTPLQAMVAGVTLATHTYAADGVYTIRAIARSTSGRTSVNAVRVQAGSLLTAPPPTGPTITALSNDTFTINAPPGDVDFYGSGLDDPNITTAQLMSPDGLSATNTGIVGVTGPDTFSASFPAAASGATAGDGYAVLLDADLAELTNRIPITWVAPARSFDSFAPMTLSLAAVAAGFDLTCTGHFVDPASELSVLIAQPNMGGVELRSTSVTKTSETEIVGHFLATTGMVVGSAQVIVDSIAASFYPGSGFIDWTP